MKKLILLLTGVAFVATIVSAQLQTNKTQLTLHKATVAANPDGVIKTDGTEPWTSTWITMAAEKSTNTVHEMTAFFQLAYNDEYLWIAGQQKGNSTIDTGAAAIPNTWERDDFETFIGLDTTTWLYKGVYGEAEFQFREQRATTFPWMFDDHNSAYTNNPKGWAIGNVDAGDGSFVEEWQIPWSALTAVFADSTAKFNGNWMKFEIQAADNTTDAAGGRDDQRFWINSSDNEYQDSRTTSVVYLADKVGGVAVKNVKLNNIITTNTIATDVLRLSATAQVVNIYDITGKLVLKTSNVNSINVSNFAPGLYIFRANNQQAIKFVKK